MVTADFLKEILDYDPVSGIFLWKFRADKLPQWNARYSGTRAGTLTVEGYRILKINNGSYREHRMAWLYVNGRLPKLHLDHRNGVKDDNRLCNLREATDSQNAANRLACYNSLSGIKGVVLRGRSWVARIRINRQLIHLGSFSSADEAKAAYYAAAVHYHGDFARVA